ncbi:hypothetical protein Mgra_00002576 [Meloidogyne graminicola]|uniref:Uncharacterized protein n=1 Tax=Meloidogyne graminicola TaxID=189291 RepID=A0A8S9ZY72_9BILA|nr:hypothetical protein Mgra_00002576 [Meloidogyne graminicola]
MKSPLYLSFLQSNYTNQDAAIAAAAAEGARLTGQQITPPKIESTRRLTNEFQIFLCLLGALLSISVSIWMAILSKDSLAKRALISSVAALCALIFSLLVLVAIKKRRRKSPVEDIEISQSILREHRKSMTSSMRQKGTGEEYLKQIRRHSSVIAVDSARQQLLQKQKAKAIQNSQSPALLTVDSPDHLPKRATSISH